MPKHSKKGTARKSNGAMGQDIEPGALVGFTEVGADTWKPPLAKDGSWDALVQSIDTVVRENADGELWGYIIWNEKNEDNRFYRSRAKLPVIYKACPQRVSEFPICSLAPDLVRSDKCRAMLNDDDRCFTFTRSISSFRRAVKRTLPKPRQNHSGKTLDTKEVSWSLAGEALSTTATPCQARSPQMEVYLSRDPPSRILANSAVSSPCILVYLSSQESISLIPLQTFTC